MNITFCTCATQHLLPFIKTPQGAYRLVTFNDGELYLRLDSDVNQQPVTVVAATPAPATHLLELWFLLDTLNQSNARIHLFFTYFGYARQDHPKPLVARSARIISTILKQFAIERMTILHPHNEHLHEHLTFTPFIPYELYTPIAQELGIEVVLAPDRGALAICQTLAKRIKCNWGHVNKVRPTLDAAKALTLKADVKHKKVLIFDDIISTGNTIIQAAQLAQEHGAREIYALVTHNVANEATLNLLAQSPIKHLWVTNSLAPRARTDQMSVINIAPTLTTPK